MAIQWDKIEITTEQNTKVEAQAPIIISASRSTDIPAFYTDWFINRLKKGYLQWKNPFNNSTLFVSFKKTRLIVFWSKNPKPLQSHIDWLFDNYPNFYFQYTLNDYDKTIEEKVPQLFNRIETFVKLSEKIGKEKVIWRFDPLLLTKEIGTEELLRKIEKIGNQLKSYTNKFVFSFADINVYKKVQNNLRKTEINYIEFDEKSMNEIAQGILELNKNWNFEIGTCAEKIDFEKYGILHNKCIDDNLIKKLFYKDKELMKFIGYDVLSPDLYNNSFRIEKIRNENLKDTGQRELCGCIYSKDIGQYNTCPHGCVYCYANTSNKVVLENYKRAKESEQILETITGI